MEKYYELDPDEGTIMISISNLTEQQKEDIKQLNVGVMDTDFEEVNECMGPNQYLYCLDVNKDDATDIICNYLKQSGYKNIGHFLEHL